MSAVYLFYDVLSGGKGLLPIFIGKLVYADTLTGGSMDDFAVS